MAWYVFYPGLWEHSPIPSSFPTLTSLVILWVIAWRKLVTRIVPRMVMVCCILTVLQWNSTGVCHICCFWTLFSLNNIKLQFLHLLHWEGTSSSLCQAGVHHPLCHSSWWNRIRFFQLNHFTVPQTFHCGDLWLLVSVPNEATAHGTGLGGSSAEGKDCRWLLCLSLHAHGYGDDDWGQHR